MWHKNPPINSMPDDGTVSQGGPMFSLPAFRVASEATAFGIVYCLMSNSQLS